MKSEKVKPTVLVTEGCYRRGKDVYDSVDDLEIISAPGDEDILSGMVKKKKAFAVVLGSANYTGPLYEAMETGGVIARFGVGCDNLDIHKAKDEGLYVTNTPGVLETTVAELTVFLAGEVLRRPGRATEEIRQGKWNPVPGKELYGKIWAILGLGNIGQKVSSILSFGFGTRVFALKRSIPDPDRLREEFGVEKISSDFAEIVPHADIVSIHIPANEHTRHFLNKERLQQLKRGAVLINTGRGSLIDEVALYDALKSNHLAGAGLDVFEHEPYEPVDSSKDLRELPNVVCTPHTGSNAEECSERMTRRVVQNIRFALDGKYERMDIVSAKS